MHNKCNALESSPNHPPLNPCLVRGKIVFDTTDPWCQKSWVPPGYVFEHHPMNGLVIATNKNLN